MPHMASRCVRLIDLDGRLSLRLQRFVPLAAGFLLAMPGVASAQMAPSAADIATYEGLHAAAASGSVVEIDRLVKQGAALNARDGNGRTPMMVAAFRQDDAA